MTTVEIIEIIATWFCWCAIGTVATFVYVLEKLRPPI